MSTVVRGAALPAVVAVLLVAATGLVSAPTAALSALAGGAMAMAALLVGPVLQRLCRTLEPSMVLGIAILGYCTVIIVLWAVYTQLMSSTWLQGGYAAAGVFVAVIAWIMGQMRAVSRVRQLLYDDPDSTVRR